MKKFLALFALLFGCGAAFGQALNAHPYSYLSAASNNSTLVYAGPNLVQALFVINTTGTVYYLKLYDKATAPTCGTDTPKWRIPLPINAATAVPTEGLQFNLGTGFCIVANLVDSDNTNAATGVAVNFGIAWQ
jgi:hypothetical protein